MSEPRAAAALVLAFLPMLAGVPPAAERPRQGAFDLEALFEIRHPSVPEWSPAGDRIAFLWQQGTAVGLWLVEAVGEEPGEPVVVDPGDDGRPVGSFAWAPDGSALAWSDGDLHLWTVGSDTGTRRRLTETDAPETVPAFTPDGARLVFARGEEVRVVELVDGREAGEDDEVGRAEAVDDAGGADEARGARRPERFGEVEEAESRVLARVDARVLALRVAPDGSRVAVLAERSETRVLDAASTVGDKLLFRREESDSPDLALVALEATAGTRLRWLERGPARSGSVSWSDDGRLAWQEVSADARTRRIVVADGPGWEPSIRVEETDPAWWSLTWLDAGPRWEPGGDRIAFLSDRDGWCHLYLLEVPPDPGAGGGGEAPAPLQVTRGRYEVEDPAWDPAGGRLVVAANRASATERSLWLVPVPRRGNDAASDAVAPPGRGTGRGPAGEEQPTQRSAGGEPQPLSRLRGTSTRPRWSPDGETILFLHADPERPLDLWRQPPRDAAATRLTDSWPEEVSAEELVEPVVVRFVGSDGELVPGLLLTPPGPGDQPGPGLVWVHGGGVRQNRWGWPPLRGYAIFYGLSQLLVQRGYTVLAVDYRGSIGYGREFRVAHHLDLGGVDLDDVLAAGRYLRRLEQPRIGKVGVWGISYGGYLVLQALVAAPPAFDAAVDVAGVTDWVDWARDPGGPWIIGRMGDPDDNPELYRERSPLHGVGRIVRPLLVLHGTDDRAVPVLHSLRLLDALVQAGRPFESMIYPGETHVFSRPATWRDAFRRLEAFLDDHLR